MDHIGRVEDFRLLTGRGRFTDDLAVPGALWGVFVRSPHAHAQIRSVDRSGAMAVAGARLVIDGADAMKAGLKPIPVTQRLTDAGGRPPRETPWQALAHGRVRHVGECVALCIADTAAAAAQMAEAVAVDYEALASVTDVQAAIRAGAPEIWPSAPGNVAFQWTLGDRAKVEAAMTSAAHVIAAEVTSQRVIVCPMEPRAAIATYEPVSDTYHLHAGNQGMTILRDQLAHIAGVANAQVVVTSYDVGGGFGIKNGTYPEYPALMLAAKLLGRPVRWTGTRSEAFVSDAQARDLVMSGRLALDAEGRILALDIRSTAALGAYVHPVGYFITCANFARCLSGPYRIPVVHAEVTCVATNTVPIAPYRGAGRPEAAAITESLMETAARQLKLDVIEIRRRNMLGAAEMPHTTAVGMTYCSGDFPGLLDQAIATAKWAEMPERKAEAHARGLYRGIGIGVFVEISGGVPNERAKMALGEDGRVHLRTALGATGQGHQTVFAMLAAEQLGIPADRIVVAEGDSRGFVDGGGASASRSTTMAGLAIRATSHQLIDKARARAAERLQTAAEVLVYQDGRFAAPGTNLAIGLLELAGDGQPPILAEARIEAESTFPSGCHVAEVEIDPETGAITLVAYSAVDDCGRVIAHEFAEGQVHGGLAQGIGQALMEHGFYDNGSGQLVAGSFMDYTLPRAADLPKFTSILQPSPARSNPLGVKGIGESGTVGALPAIANAIRDALEPLGVTQVPMPATPARIWQAIQAAASRAKPV